jgi:hypothetical protein
MREGARWPCEAAQDDVWQLARPPNPVPGPAPYHWWQQVWFGARRECRDLGVFDVAKHGSLRSFIDSQTEHPGIDKGLPKRDSSLRAGMQAGKDGKLGGVEGRIRGASSITR